MFKSLIIIIASSLFAMNITAQEETSVLFIGNSFTFMNNMPTMFRDISISKGKNVYVDSIVEGGKDLNYHSSQALTYEKIKSRKWDYVVLQGHSNEFAQPDSRVDKSTLPFAEKLVDSIRNNSPCTQLILYMTWAYKNGNSKWSPIASYDSMQYRIKLQYLRFADLLDAKISPVGEVWKNVRTNYSGINLYDPDNQHPSEVGSYLSACTHFTTIFGESPVKNQANIKIALETKQIIEMNASQIVLNNLNQWRNIPTRGRMESGFDLIQVDDTVQLVNRSKNATWMEWDFGDSAISIDENPKHIYIKKGTFVITQKLTNPCKTVILRREIEIK